MDSPRLSVGAKRLQQAADVDKVSLFDQRLAVSDPRSGVVGRFLRGQPPLFALANVIAHRLIDESEILPRFVSGQSDRDASKPRVAALERHKIEETCFALLQSAELEQ